MRFIKLAILTALLGVGLTTFGQESKEKKSTPAYTEYQSWSLGSSAGYVVGLTQGISFYAFGFNPRYNIIAPKPYFSVSAGIPLNLGIDFFGTAGGSIFRFMTDVPVTIDLNLGTKATPFDESFFGGFIGGGVGYNWMHLNLAGDKSNFHTIGAMGHVGIKWRYYGRVTGLRVAYMEGINTGQTDDQGEPVPGNRIVTVSLIYEIN